MKTDRQVINKEISYYAGFLAQGVYDHSGVEGLVETRAQIRWIIRYMRSKPEFVAAVEDETYTAEQESELIHTVFAGFNPVLLDVIGVMAERRDMRLIPRVFHAFDELLCDKLDIVAVDVTTAVEIDDNIRQAIRDKVQRDLGKKAIINERVDKKLLGGIIMSVQGKRIDASMRAQLDKARVALKENNMEVK